MSVRVIQVPQSEIPDNRGEWFYDPATGEATIKISKKQPIQTKRYILYHELQHVLVDLLHVGLEYRPAIVATEEMVRLRKAKR